MSSHLSLNYHLWLQRRNMGGSVYLMREKEYGKYHYIYLKHHAFHQIQSEKILCGLEKIGGGYYRTLGWLSADSTL